MSILFKYMFRQVSMPFLFFTGILTMMIWLTQSLNMLDLIINGGQSFATFFYLVILVLPSMLTVILPVALFCGILYGLNRFYSDSEIVVMWSSGISRWRLLAPVLTVAMLVTLANFAMSLYLMPLGYRNMKDRIYEIRSDLAASFIREGEFTSKIKGLTVYIATAPSHGDLEGILVHDSRRPDRPRTYLAERGVFLRTPEGPRLVMHKGEVQEMAGRDGRLQVLKFESTILDLGEFETASGGARVRKDLSERYLGELFFPEEADRLEDNTRTRFIAEGHSRLATPLYCVAFALIAFIAVICGTFTRRGYSARIVVAMVCVVTLRMLGFAAQSVASTTPALNPLQYGVPLGAVAICAMMIAQVPPFEASRRLLRLGKAAVPGDGRAAATGGA
ncbi:MAG: LPS export ABC transporter permease LptF [Alphaproteobacteria bacterium]